MEEVIAGVLDAVSVHVFPPAASEVAGIAGPELGFAVLEQLELALHWERVVGDEGVVVEALTGDVDDACGRWASARARGCWADQNQRNGHDPEPFRLVDVPADNGATATGRAHRQRRPCVRITQPRHTESLANGSRRHQPQPFALPPGVLVQNVSGGQPARLLAAPSGPGWGSAGARVRLGESQQPDRMPVQGWG